MMFPIGTMFSRGFEYLKDKKAYLISTTQIISCEERNGRSPFLDTDCLIEFDEQTGEFEWTLRSPHPIESGCYDYEQVKKTLDENGGWVPSPEKKAREGICDW